MTKVLVLKILYDGRAYNSKELGEKLEISPSTVRKIISCLRDTGVQIKTIRGKNGGYVLSEKTKIW